MDGWLDLLSIVCFRRAKAVYNYYLEPRIEYKQVSTVEPAAAVKPSPPPWLQNPEVDVIPVQPVGSDEDDTEHPMSSSSDEERDCFIEELTSHYKDPMTRISLGDLKEEIAQMADIDYLGKIYFSLHYRLSTFTLVVKVIKAEDLPEHLSLCPGVFLETFLCPAMPEAQSQKSDIVQKLLDPVFHQTLELPLPYEETLKQTLNCRVCYLDKFTQRNIVGEIIHPLDHLEADNMDITKEEVVLCREIQQVPEVEEVISDLIGQLMFSLTFIPETKRLTVVIFKAKVMKFPEDPSGAINPAIFVEVSIQHNSRRKRRMTTMKIGSLTPVYNEAITFDLSMLKIDDIKLQFLVKHQANRSASTIIGRVVLGPNCEGQAKQHWEKALVARKPLAFWHDLQEYTPPEIPNHKKKRRVKKVMFTDKPVQRFLNSSDEEES